MNKFRCCRFHNLFVFLLVLCALSLTSHYLADAAAFTTGIVPCQAQQSSENCTTSPDEMQGASLHGGFMLNKLLELSILPAIWVRVETNELYSLTWEPPTLVRPPIL
jgi:hypothetical protein